MSSRSSVSKRMGISRWSSRPSSPPGAGGGLGGSCCCAAGLPAGTDVSGAAPVGTDMTGGAAADGSGSRIRSTLPLFPW